MTSPQELEQTAGRPRGRRVVYTPHIKAGADTLCEARLMSSGVKKKYGGFGLPVFVSNIILQMISRTRAGLTTIVRLPARVVEDLEILGGSAS